MAVLPPVENVARIVMKFVWSGESCVNVYHARPAVGGVSPDVVGLATAIKNWWNTDLKVTGNLSSDLALHEIEVTDLTSAASAQYKDVVGLPSPATGGASVPNNSAAIMHWQTGVRVRGGVGKTFIPGVPESGTSGQVLTSSYRTQLETPMLALLTRLAAMAAAHELVQVSYYQSNGLRETPEVRPILSGQLAAQMGSQRCRLTGRKRKKRPTP